ncbi:MAG: hypothetical protein H8E11_06945, partial [Candidatus Cloacimonetes bacterium]|nr:hypothetical protein [Candidatus Cloacimonadota bacterium]
MKNILIALILLLGFCLYAQDTDNTPLDLGDVHIYGETYIPSDTTGMYRDITQYYAVSTSNFEYKPYFSFVDIPFPKPEFVPRIAAIQFKGGNNYCGDFKGSYHANNILKLTSKFSYKNWKENWQNTSFMFGWQPEVLNSDLNINFQQNVYKFNDAKTEITGFGFNWQNINTLFPNENAAEINFTLGINKLIQEDGTSNAENDFYFKSIIAHKTRFALVNFSGNYLRNSFCGELSVSSDWQPYVESAGLWLGASNKSHICPSLILNKKFDLLPEFYLSIINQPRLFTRSQLDLLDLDNYLDIDPDKRHAMRPLDLKITAGINWIADLAMYYNPLIEIDHAEFLPQAGESIHQLEYDNIALQKVGATVSLKSGRLLVKENFEYTTSANYIYKDQLIPYLAELQNKAAVLYSNEPIKTELELSFISGRKDENKDELDDVLLLNFNSSYRFRENIQVLFEIENLLDAEYKQFS